MCISYLDDIYNAFQAGITLEHYNQQFKHQSQSLLMSAAIDPRNQILDGPGHGGVYVLDGEAEEEPFQPPPDVPAFEANSNETHIHGSISPDTQNHINHQLNFNVSRSTHQIALNSDRNLSMSPRNLQYFDKHDYNLEPDPNAPSQIKKNVFEAYSKLNDYVEDVHIQITEQMKKSEEDFLFVYKEQMFTIQKQMKLLKKKMDDELLRQKANDKMNILTEERDYFKTEALRLDKTCKQQEREIEELHFKLKVLTEDKNYYEGFVIETKKENKALKSELLQLYKFKASEEKLLSKTNPAQKPIDKSSSQPNINDQNQPQSGEPQDFLFDLEQPPQTNTQQSQQHRIFQQPDEIFLSEIKSPQSIQGVTQVASTTNQHGRLSTPATTITNGFRKEILMNTGHSTSTNHQFQSGSTGQNFFGANSASQQQSRDKIVSRQLRARPNKNSNNTQTLDHSEVGVPSQHGGGAVNITENNSRIDKEQFMQKKHGGTTFQVTDAEAKNLETIKQLRILLDKERIALQQQDIYFIVTWLNTYYLFQRKAKAELSQCYFDRSQLEAILLDCISETKKDISRRRAVQRADQFTLQGSNLKSQLANLRLTMHLNSDEEVPFTQFTPKDKIQTLKAFLSSDEFLDSIYQITFGHSKLAKTERLQVDLGLTDSAHILRASQSQADQKFKLAESWKQDAQQAQQMFHNFKGFKYSFKPQTTMGVRNVSTTELKSPLYNKTTRTNKNLALIQSNGFDTQHGGSSTVSTSNTNLALKQKLYKEVCKEFSQKQLNKEDR